VPRSIRSLFSVFVRAFLLAALCLPATSAIGQLRGYDDDGFGAPPFPLVSEIDPNSGASSVPAEWAGCPGVPANTLFAEAGFPLGFTSGFAVRGGDLYGIGWTFPGIYLYKVDSTFCATARQVDPNTPTGLANLQSLAYCPDNDRFYSADFDFAAHTGRLIEIDPTTGAGTVIGLPMSFDVRIVGMACDPVDGTLYAVTSAFGATRPDVELLTIDRATGVEALVGDTGLAPNTLESLTLNGLVTPAQLMGADEAVYELDPVTGAATLIGGVLPGMWGLGSQTVGSPLSPPVLPAPVFPHPLWGIALLLALAGLVGRRVLNSRD